MLYTFDNAIIPSNFESLMFVQTNDRAIILTEIIYYVKIVFVRKKIRYIFKKKTNRKEFVPTGLL